MKKKIISVIFIICATIAIHNYSKAASATIHCDETCTVNNPINISVSGSAVQWNLTLKVNGKIISTSNELENVDGNKAISLSGTYTPTTEGNLTVTLEGSITEATNGETINSFSSKVIKVITSNTQTPEPEPTPDPIPTPEPEPTPDPKPTPEPEPKKSNNANLSNLGITPNDFSGFKANKLSYDVEVPNDVEKVEIYAKKGHDKQTITGNGIKKLEVGKNTAVVTVVAEDGTTKKEYTLNITRLEAKEDEPEENNTDEEEVFGLQKLEIEGIQLNPEFKTDLYEYKINLREDKEKLDIKTVATTKDVNIQVSGNENLKEGENTITILVENTDTKKVVTYQITVNKVLPIEQVTQTKSNKLIDKQVLILVAVAIVIVVLIAVLVIKHLRQNQGVYGQVPFSGLNEDEDEDFYNDEDEDQDEDENDYEYDQYDNSEFDNIETEEDDEEEEFEEYSQRKNRFSKGKRFR